MNNYYTVEYPSIPLETNKMNIQSNWKYRQYMQQNAKDVMKYNSMEYINSSGNNPYTLINTEPVEHTPFVYENVYDSSKPKCGYRDTDLKQDYLKKEQMKSRMIAPSIPTRF